MRLALPLLVSLVLTACAHAPQPAAAPRTGGPATALARMDLFPSKPGTVWQYEVVGHPPGDPYVDYPGVETVRLERTSTRSGRTTLELRAIDDFSNAYRFPEISWDERGITLRGVTYMGPMADGADGHAIALVQFPLVAGKKWDDGLWAGEVLGEETVKVPAGTFKAWKIGAIGTYQQAYTCVGTYWIAPGAGIVKSELNTQAGTFESVLIPAGRTKR